MVSITENQLMSIRKLEGTRRAYTPETCAEPVTIGGGRGRRRSAVRLGRPGEYSGESL